MKEKEQPEAAAAAAATMEQPAAATKRARELTEEEDEGAAKKGKTPAKAPAARKATPGGRRAGKLTITRALSDDEDRMRSVASFRRQLNRAHRQQQVPPPAGPREVIIPETITVAELANRMAITLVEDQHDRRLTQERCGPQILDRNREAIRRRWRSDADGEVLCQSGHGQGGEE